MYSVSALIVFPVMQTKTQNMYYSPLDLKRRQNAQNIEMYSVSAMIVRPVLQMEAHTMYYSTFAPKRH